MIALVPLSREPDDTARLQRVLDAAPGYAVRVTGLPPAPTDARDVLAMLPPGKDHADKRVFGIALDGALVGCIDIVRGWPDRTTAIVGLLLVDESLHRRGIGREACAELERLVVGSWPECVRLRIGVVDTNAAAALPFWVRMGFAPTGETKPHRSGTVVGTTTILVKPLVRPPSAATGDRA